MSTHIGIGQCRWHDGDARCNCHRDNHFREKFPYAEVHHRLHDDQADEESYDSYDQQYIEHCLRTGARLQREISRRQGHQKRESHHDLIGPDFSVGQCCLHQRVGHSFYYGYNQYYTYETDSMLRKLAEPPCKKLLSLEHHRQRNQEQQEKLISGTC